MDRKSRALALNEFVTCYTNMWNDEIMNEYPESMQHYPREWIDILTPLHNDELFAIDTKNINHPIFEKIANTSLDAFIRVGLSLSKLPVKNLVHPVKFEQWAYNGIKAKKRHEIDRIIPAINELKEKFHLIKSLILAEVLGISQESLLTMLISMPSALTATANFKKLEKRD